MWRPGRSGWTRLPHGAERTRWWRQLRGGIEALFRQKKVELLRGTGTILGPGVVAVGDATYTADHILIRSARLSARPPIPGLELAVTSDELLAGGQPLPASLVIIGGGVIGVELASLYSALGCQVTVLEAMDRLLPQSGPGDRTESCHDLQKAGHCRGSRGHGQRCGAPGGRPAGRLLHLEGPAGAGHWRCRALRHRPPPPNTAGLFGEGISLEMERGRILTDETGQTSMPGVYAAGDVTAQIQLAHVAAAQGTSCADRLAGRTPLTDLRTIPSCVYTDPEIASVGLTADEAKAAGRAVKVGKYVMFSNGRTVIASGQRGFIKVVADRESGAVLGAQLMCQRATDLVSQFTAAVVNGLTAEQLLHVMRPHPTFDEGIGEALEDLLEKLTG